MAKLAPFMLRARAVEVGRDRLEQVKNRLAFMLITTDLSENSRKKILEEFSCPIYQCLTSGDIEELFEFKGTKVLGFRRSPLSVSVLPELKEFLIERDGLLNAPEPLPENPRIAVLGASGIGKFHCGWWKAEGHEPVAFLGSSEDSVKATAGKLHEMFGISPRSFTSLDALLEEIQPDIVDICLPPEMHYAAAKSALERGCHVLCEKPFVYDGSVPHGVLRDQCEELQTLAESNRRMLGLCTQYIMAIQECYTLYKEHTGNDKPESYIGTLCSPGTNRVATPENIWLDLAPHMLAGAQFLSGNGRINFKTLRTEFSEKRVRAAFECERRGGEILNCEIGTAFRDVEPRSIRRFIIDGCQFDIEGRKEADGTFAMLIKTPWGDFERPDMLRLLLRSFLHGKVEMSPKMARRNMDWLLRVLEQRR
ncbi:MAG: Gfo/Idh/MocA family oxidoreductase [Victivallales bacterium]|nr:Gfo/Idh/MocA family oxidoreductase [Victivallales bacterium]